MIVGSNDDKKIVFPDFLLSGTAHKVCNEMKYLGHRIVNDLSIDKNINRQCHKMYG